MKLPRVEARETQKLSVILNLDITRICAEYQGPLRARGRETKRERGRERERMRQRESERELASEKERSE